MMQDKHTLQNFSMQQLYANLSRGCNRPGNGTFDTDLPRICKTILPTAIVYSVSRSALVLLGTILKEQEEGDQAMFTPHLPLKAVDQYKKLAYRHYPLYHWTISHLPNASMEIGKHLAWKAFERARKQVPAYRRFLAEQGFVDARHASLAEQFASIPPTDKNDYVRVFSTAERCVGGRIPAAQVIVDESSGSTGLPYNWVRSKVEVDYTRRVCSYFLRHALSGEPLFVINAFSMGAWATGITMSAALEHNGI